MTSEQAALVRLNKYIADSGLCSRRKADDLIAQGKVMVNGKRVSEAGSKINPQADRVSVEGKLLAPVMRKIYIALHKPKGVVTTRNDPQKRKTIYDCLPEAVHSVDPAGRLDRDSTGLLILSSDGDLIYRITHPKYHLEKTYHVTLNKQITEKHVQALYAGVMLSPENKKAQMDKIEALGENRYRMVLITGYNRQIRRSLEAMGYRVKTLKRVAFGPIKLGDLPPGKHRMLTPAEIKALGGGASSEQPPKNTGKKYMPKKPLKTRR